jgi:hypothetical protein
MPDLAVPYAAPAHDRIVAAAQLFYKLLASMLDCVDRESENNSPGKTKEWGEPWCELA